jgi:succinyl-CoA synthetase beta subunit
MYSLFISQDLDLVEINPLGISKIGNVMALDGKINVNDLALPRHPQFKQAISTNKSIRLNKTGNIGIITNGWGIALRTLDALAWQKGTPNTCIIVEDVFCSHAWKNALQELRKIKDIKVIFLHLIDSPFIQEIVNTALGKFIAKTNVPYVVSLFEQTELLGTLEKSTNFYPSPSLDDAVLRVVQEAKK